MVLKPQTVFKTNHQGNASVIIVIVTVMMFKVRHEFISPEGIFLLKKKNTFIDHFLTWT